MTALEVEEGEIVSQSVTGIAGRSVLQGVNHRRIQT